MMRETTCHDVYWICGLTFIVEFVLVCYVLPMIPSAVLACLYEETMDVVNGDIIHKERILGICKTCRVTDSVKGIFFMHHPRLKQQNGVVFLDSDFRKHFFIRTNMSPQNIHKFWGEYHSICEKWYHKEIDKQI
eukprot:TRINITY_DN13091_c0_g1_i1.p1 TRINITY_DN13091_c0_g1~~TRINITY_DN13091_c0_g1_i1.p1  ORF type:complete len:134 (-),score=14.20 TRINITY_DN13091_c0_g1_i1:204-605(-)